jgi:hypothetical protein
VHYYKTPSPKAVAQQKESGISRGLIRIIHQPGALVEESGSGLLKGDTVLVQVRAGLAAIPGKFDIAHSIILILAISQFTRFTGML